jgi:MFS transporter, DHA1 family, tetracycline resistance protein
MNKNINFLNMLSLFMVIVVDVMGIVLVLPVLTPLILQADSGMLPLSISAGMRDFYYGLTLALFPLFMFFSAPVLGDLSDKFGRKKILMLCLIGTVFSYLISAFGIIHHQFVFLLAGRVIAGLAAGTQPIATAAIIDLSTPQTKTRHLSWIVLSASLGVVFGPLLGGLTAEKDMFSWFSYETPFIIAAALAFLNAILLHFNYKDLSQIKKSQPIHLAKGFILFMAAFSNEKFRLLSITYFCYLLAWSLYFQTISWYFMEVFQYTSLKIGLFMGFIGVVFAITTTIIVRIAARIFNREENSFLFFIFIMLLANVGAAIANNEAMQWLLVVFNAIGDAICYTIALSLFSNLADENSQGWIMGVATSISAIIWAIGGFLAGPLGFINIHAPFWIASLLSLLSFVLMMVYKKILPGLKVGLAT